MKPLHHQSDTRYAAWNLRGAAVLFLLSVSAGTASAAKASTLVPGGMTAPLNGFVAAGSAINPNTGRPVRHLWISDHLQGLCRIDPDLDTAATLPPGRAFINLETCTTSGPAVYDAKTQTVYVVDGDTNVTNKGVVRQSFVPSGDGGHGRIDAETTRLGDASSCGIPDKRPSSLTQGPDGNLYLGFLNTGNIMRINNPGKTAVPCSDFQTIGSSADNHRTLGLAWVEHTLYGLDGGFPWRINNADQCATTSQPNACTATVAFSDAVIVPNGIGSNQSGTAPNGTALYIADIDSITKIDDPNGASLMTTYWVTGLSLPSSISIDTAAASRSSLYVADDPTVGVGLLQGRVFKVRDTCTSVTPIPRAQTKPSTGRHSPAVNC